MKLTTTIMTLSLALGVVFGLPAFAADEAMTSDEGQLDLKAIAPLFGTKPPYSPYAGRNFPTRPFFGDTHVHTSFSMDAGAFGCRLGPKDAYRFAKGEEVTASSGQRVKLSRPLDFMVVADHSDGFGLFPQLFAGDPRLLAYPQGRKWYDMLQSGQGAEAAIDIIMSFSQGKIAEGLVPVPSMPAYRSAWHRRDTRTALSGHGQQLSLVTTAALRYNAARLSEPIPEPPRRRRTLLPCGTAKPVRALQERSSVTHCKRKLTSGDYGDTLSGTGTLCPGTGARSGEPGPTTRRDARRAVDSAVRFVRDRAARPVD